MRLSTHRRTSPSRAEKPFDVLFLVGIGLLYSLFLMGSFACFYYAKNVPGGILMLMIPTAMTIGCCIVMNDMGKAYIEVDGNTIRVVDYLFGIKKEKLFSFADITHAEIVSGHSRLIKGYRFSAGAARYIVLMKGNKYLFKIVYTADASNIFKSYLV